MSKSSKSTSNSTESDKKLNDFEVRHEPDPTKSFSDYSLDKVFYDMILEEPFLSCVMACFERSYDWKCDTAYVSYNNDTSSFNMRWNPDFMLKYCNSEQKKKFVILHETYHVILKHLTKRSVRTPGLASLANVAMDLAINSLLIEEQQKAKVAAPEMVFAPGLKPIFCKDEKLTKYVVNAKKLQSADFYLEELKELYKQELQEKTWTLTPGTGIDQHDMWGEVDSEDIAEEVIDGILDAATQEAQKKTNTWGSIPQSIQDMILSRRTKTRDWKAYLRFFMKRLRAVQTESSMKRYNKKAPYIQPGFKRTTTSRVIVFIDQSGSMSNEDIARGFNEICQIAEHGTAVSYNFDTDIDFNSKTTWKKNQVDVSKWKRTKCGGTDFSCIAEYLNKNKGLYDGAIIITDGYASQIPPVKGTRVLFLITPDGTAESKQPTDMVVFMDKDKKASI